MRKVFQKQNSKNNSLNKLKNNISDNQKVKSDALINHEIKNIFLRYIFLIILSIGNLAIFYKILTPLTVHTLNFFLTLTQKTQVVGNRILMEGLAIDIIPACVAGSAFYLLTILVMSIPRMKADKRMKMISIAFVSLFAANIARLVFLVNITDLASFDFIHWLFYNFISVLFVVGIWTLLVKIYQIKEIPIYSDLRFLHQLRSGSPKRKLTKTLVKKKK